MCATLCQAVPEIEGNTIISKHAKRHYILTINNYTEEDKQLLQCANVLTKVVAQAEVGEQGTKHIQAYICFNKKVRFNQVKELFPRAHIEVCGNVKESILYCQKVNSKDAVQPWEFFKGVIKTLIVKPILFTDLREHQAKLAGDILAFNGEYRKILWFLDYKGNYGKSLVCKYLYDNFNSIVISSGKSSDIFFIIKNLIEQNKEIKTVIFDIPRSSLEYINYSAIELLYTGLITCGKYESCTCRFNPPERIIVMANEEPAEDKWSKDRLIIRQLCLPRN